MRKNLLVLLGLLTFAAGFSQGVVVSTTANGNANPTQLVNSLIMYNDNCLTQPSNATKSTGLSTVNYAQGNSVGSYTNTNTAFPFNAGVVLVTGAAATATGPNTSISTDSGAAAQTWLGDADINAALAGLPGGFQSMNATVLEFDFTAVTANLNIPYIFASEEFGTFQCASKDGMAILIKPATAPNSAYQNIALIPGTNTPVSVVTLRNSAYNGNCANGSGSAYFGLFNGGGAAATAANNFEGQSVVLNATTNALMPGTVYHIKIVVADDGQANANPSGTDPQYNSAVFLQSGSFNLGQAVVGIDLTAAANTALCQGETLTINTGLSAAQYSVTWTRNSQPHPGGITTTITQNGTYTATITNTATNCSTVESVDIEFTPQITPGPANTIYACPDGNGTYTYNLALNTPSLKQGLDPATIVTYHASQGAADAGTDAVNATAYAIANSGTVTVYARVKSANSSCYVVVPFTLAIIPSTTATAPATLQACEGTMGSNTASVNLTSQSATILGAQDVANYAVTYYTNSTDANAATNNITTASNYAVTGPSQVIWARVQSLQSTGCFAVTSFTINVNPIPPVATQNNQTACGSYILPALPANSGSYFTQSGGNGPIAAGSEITSTQTLYIYAVNAGGCSNQTTFTVTVLQGSAAPVPDNVTACTSYTLPALPAGQEYHSAAGGAPATLLPAGTVITATQPVYFYIPTAAACTTNSSFTVTIITADDPADVFTCTPYTLPALTNGTYHTQPGGTGTPLAAGAVINTTQTIYVYNAAPDASCFVENSFVVNVNAVTPVADLTRCNSFTLPALTVGNYYSQPNGQGPVLNAGTVITTSQTLYVFYQAPNGGCTSEDSFAVTISPLPPIGNYPAVIACDQYVLPADPAIVGYYTQDNGMGTFYAAGTVITSTITLKATTAPNADGCRNWKTFTITIVGTTADTPGDSTNCGSYTLPALAAGQYRTGPNGTGTVIAAGTVITSTQEIWVRVVTPQCTAEGSFMVTILPIPSLDSINHVVACNSYTLPPLPNGNYFTGPNGTGTPRFAGDVISATTTMYVFASTNTTPACTNQRQFNIFIVTPAIIPANVITCGTYTVPAPSASYITYYNAPNQGGGVIAPGTVISATKTIYVYANVNSGTNCSSNYSYTVTITTAPSVDDPADVVACNSYTLPALSSGEYWTMSGGAAGGGVMLPAGQVINNSQTIYVYNSNPGCGAENDFEVTINNISVPTLPAQNVCADPGYLLEPLPNGNYYTMAGGPATPGNVLLNAGEFITSANTTPTDVTVYIYDEVAGTNPLCFAESSFVVTLNPNPVIPNPGPQASCSSYILPPLSNGNYFTLSGGSGTMLTAGQEINTDTVLYIYAESGGTPNCISENELQIIVNPTPPGDVTACDGYILPALLAGGEYRTQPNGGGNLIPYGTEITTTQTIYYFVPTAAACTATTSFVVTINNIPVLDAVGPVSECDTYVLPVLSAGNYYTAAGGPTGGGQVIPAGTEIEVPVTWDPAVEYTQMVYVYAETGTVPNCSAETSFLLTLYKTPALDARSNIERCDSYTFEPLSPYNHYYALDGGPNVPGQTEYFPGDVITSTPVGGTTFFIYTESPLNPGCNNNDSSYRVEIFSASVDAEINAIQADANASGDYYASAYNDEIVPGHPLGQQRVVDIEACDSFTLPDLNVGGTDPNDSYVQQYYTLPDGPENTDPAQQEVNNLTITANTTVYLYRRLIGRLECKDQSRLNIVINTTPVINYTPADFSACDQFTLPALTVGNYFNSPGGVDPITDLTIVNSQPVYVYAQTGTNYICSDEHMFNLTINRIDVPDDLIDPVACDSYTLPAPPAVVSTPPSAVARYFELAGGPNVSGQVEHFQGDVYLPGTYTLYVWAETQTSPNCTDEEEMIITVVPRPTAIIPTGLVTCAINDAGTPAQLQGIFDLTGAIAEAIGAQTNVAGIVFETEADANFASSNNAIPNPADYHNNGGASQTLWIRLYSTLVNGCYTVVPLQLTVNPRPIAVDPIGPYEICDNGDSDVDGIGVFDLTTYESTVLGTLDPTLHTVTYYETELAITEGFPAIASPTNYISPSTTVFIKVTINATGCYDIVPLELIVNPLPVVVNPTPYSLCDDDQTNLGQEEFDLTSKIEEIMANAANSSQGITATFYHTLDDAIAMTSGITTPTAYTNPPGTPVEAIFVRITDNVTGCYRIVLLDIRVEPLPLLTAPTADTLITCSTDNDGYGIFDLNDIADEMINGAPDVTVEFYETALNAENDLNPIQVLNPYTTNNAFSDVLYVVATNNVTGCRSIVTTLTLTVNPAPINVDLDDITQCDEIDSNDQDFSMVFDLTQQDAEIISQIQGAVAGDYIIHYFTQENFANDGQPRITNPATFVGINDQTIWVRIENPDTECFIVVSFQLHVNRPEPIAHPTNLVVCDDTAEGATNNGLTRVDLTVKNDEILTAFGIGEGNVVTYYTDAGYTNLIADPTQFDNTSNPQTVFVRVTTPQGCISTETLTIVVKPMPSPNYAPERLELCDDTLPLNDGQEPFNLNDANADILQGDSQSTLVYFATEQDAEDNVSPIATPGAYVNPVPWDDVVYARVTLTGSQVGDPGCYRVVELALHVNPLPQIFDNTGVVPRYAICNDPTTGFETFNLIGHVSDILVAAGEDPLNYDIKFYKGLPEIAAGTPLPLVYTNETPSQQTIYVVAVNRTTDCRIQTTLTLYAEQAAVANPVVNNNPIVECDYDGTNDGFTTFDLTPAGTEALGTQNPTQFSVEYYLTEAAANAGDITSSDFISTPAAFTNTVYLTQTIWVRITNTATFAPCYAVTSFDIRVSLLPEPAISSEDNDDTICVDFETGAVEKSVYLRADNTDPAVDTYQWQLNGVDIPGATAQNYTAVEEGLYTVFATNADGCTSDPIAAFEVFLSGPASPIGTGYVISNAFGDNQTITVLAQGFGEYQYSIAPEDANGTSVPTGPWQNSNVFTNVPQGYFTIYVRDVNTMELNPCSMLELHGVSVIDYPKFFTPNGDGINDYWNIVGMVAHPEARIYIFDRYGKLIKQLSPLSRTDMYQGWDGTFNGNPVPADDYWFRVEFLENGSERTFKAHFTLKR